jgi:hypothetical protein
VRNLLILKILLLVSAPPSPLRPRQLPCLPTPRPGSAFRTAAASTLSVPTYRSNTETEFWKNKTFVRPNWISMRFFPHDSRSRIPCVYPAAVRTERRTARLRRKSVRWEGVGSRSHQDLGAGWNAVSYFAWVNTAHGTAGNLPTS